MKGLLIFCPAIHNIQLWFLNSRLNPNLQFCQGAFNNYVEMKGWVGGQLNVYANQVKTTFYLLYLPTRGGWVVQKVQKIVYVVSEYPLSYLRIFLLLDVNHYCNHFQGALKTTLTNWDRFVVRVMSTICRFSFMKVKKILQ